jgi:hypothetical protein
MDLMEALVYAKEHNLDLSIRRARVQDLVHAREHTVKDWLVDCRRRGVTDFEREPFS